MYIYKWVMIMNPFALWAFSHTKLYFTQELVNAHNDIIEVVWEDTWHAHAHTHTHFNQIFIFFMLVTLWKLANKKLPDWQCLKKNNIKRTEYTLKFSYKLLVKAVSVNSWSFKMYVSWSWFIFSHIFFLITVKYKKDHFFGRFKAIFTTTQHNTT